VKEDATVTALRGAPGGPLALAVRVASGADSGQTVALRAERAISVGASADNDLHLSDRTVSRYHLELRPAPGGAQVRDLGSLNGTWLGAVRIESAVLPLGSELRIGDTLLAIDSVGAPRTPSDDPALGAIPGMVASSAPMRRVVSTIRKLAPTMVSVLIEGETGTGKEVVASAIHALSPRSEAPFVVVDCGALPPTLIASELFGHERGAFTGANRRHVGAFERAARGTLFLDEVGELPLEVQPALLGVLERRRFRRVGGEQEIASDVRVLSATHRDLRASANSGRFRSDLYFRLAVSRIVIPPLRERPDDIPALVAHFAEQLCGQAEPPGLEQRVVQELSGHHWGGNVRELRNFVENAIALGLESVSTEQRASASPEPGSVVAYREARSHAVADFERAYLTSLIHACNGNASEAARRAQMDRAYLLILLKRHGLR
jgi:DNA-binding NtrC family response regulator